jgi:hypothetical protein
MFKIMLTLHLLAVVFTIGPLVHATTTAVRGLRTNDESAAISSARMTTIYAYASILAVIFGFALMSSTSPFTGKHVAEFSETWIWLSLLLWLASAATALYITAPTLKKAAAGIDSGTGTRQLAVRISASGGLVAALLVAVIVLMVYQPGG